MCKTISAMMCALTAATILFMAASCGPVEPPLKDLQYVGLYPQKAAYNVGDTVKILFKANNRTLVAQVTALIRLNPSPVFSDPITNGGVAAAKDTIKWIIGQENAQIDYVSGSNSCIIKIREYNDGTIYDQSGTITVIAP